MQSYPFVITISSEKGGVGKTTLAVNLAIFLKAIREDLPVTVFSFDNHYTIDKMFAISRQPECGSVADLLSGEQGDQLLHTGQYGVSYIPSSSQLSKLRNSLPGPMFLARQLANSNISGIVIIDTRPELDIITQNALYAADRVFIPVKDMASLENCRNIFSLFEKKGMDKKNLALIPCLMDSRVKYDGMFKDQRSLLKAFAINRGYRCLDLFISKSPKVDSLNTNPEGRIYPILTHARGTEVYNQFAQLARQVMTVIVETPEPRAMQYKKWMISEEVRCDIAFKGRSSTVTPHCPLCGEPTIGSLIHPPGLYYEAGDESRRGFINSDCFFDLISALMNPSANKLSSSDPLGQLLLEATASATFIFKSVKNNGKAVVKLSVMEPSGRQIMQQSISYGDFADSFMNQREGRLHQLLENTLGAKAISDGDLLLLVHPVNRHEPESILKETGYRNFRNMKQHHSATA